MKVLVDSCIGQLDKIWVRGRKSCAVRPQNGRHAVRKINRAVSMKKAIEDSKRCNIPIEREREAEDSQSEERS